MMPSIKGESHYNKSSEVVSLYPIVGSFSQSSYIEAGVVVASVSASVAASIFGGSGGYRRRLPRRGGLDRLMNSI